MDDFYWVFVNAFKAKIAVRSIRPMFCYLNDAFTVFSGCMASPAGMCNIFCKMTFRNVLG